MTTPVRSPHTPAPSSRLRTGTWLSPWLVFVLISLPSTLALVFLTPPFQVPDEQQHFYRAYQISELHIVGSGGERAGGAVLPSSLPEFVERFLGSREMHTVREVRPAPLATTLRDLDRPLDPKRREFVRFAAVGYPPFPYVPQATAIGVGRLLEAPPLALLYSGRIANALTAILLIACALKWMPFGKPVATVVALLPMAQYEYASVSPDALIIASAFLFTATALRAVVRGRWTRAEIVLGAATAVIFCPVKPVYAPLLFVGLPALLADADRRRSAVIALSVVAACALGVTAVWFQIIPATSGPESTGLDPPAQVASILAHPVGFMKIFAATMAEAGYVRSAIGVLGWLNVILPIYVYALAVVALPLGILAEDPQAPRLAAISVAWNVCIIAGCVLATAVAMFVLWNVAGATVIHGIQGRYFLPFTALAVVTASSAIRLSLSPTTRAAAWILVVAIMVLTTLAMHLAIEAAYAVL